MVPLHFPRPTLDDVTCHTGEGQDAPALQVGPPRFEKDLRERERELPYQD